MNLKHYMKWPLLTIATMIIYYLSVYIPDTLNAINVFFLIAGFYLMLNSGALVKTTSENFSKFRIELEHKFDGHEKNLEGRTNELLSDYRGQYIINVFVIGFVVLIAVCLPIYYVTVTQHRWYEYVFVFCLLAFFTLHEGQTFQYFPSSRYNRTRLKFFINELQSKANSLNRLNKPNMIVNNIEMNHSEIKKEYSQIVNDNRTTIIDNTRIQVVNNTQTNIDNRVLENNFNTTIDNRVLENNFNTNIDNRVLENNFNTTIEAYRKEIRQLDLNSKFWNYFMTINDDVYNKVETLFEIIDNLNSNYFIKNDKFLIKYDSKLKKIVFPLKPTVKLAHFVKFLIYLGILKKSIAEDKNQKCLESIFECEGSEPYYYFKPGEWSKLDRTRNHFKMYYRENDM